MRRPLLLLGATASAAALAFGWVGLGPSGATSPSRRSPEPVFAVVPFRPDEVARVVVEASGMRSELVRTPEGAWRPHSGTAATVATLLIESEDEVLPLLAYRRLAVDGTRPEFGLERPEITLSVEDRSGRAVDVAIGAPSVSGGGFYAGRGGDKRLYLVARRSVDDLRSLVRGERVDTPRSPREVKAMENAQRTADPEEVTNPWLRQVIEESGESR